VRMIDLTLLSRKRNGKRITYELTSRGEDLLGAL